MSHITRKPVFIPSQNGVLGGYTVFIIPPAKQSSRRVYCFQHVRHSALPSTFKGFFLLYNFDSFCPILFKFTPHLDHQRMHV